MSDSRVMELEQRVQQLETELQRMRGGGRQRLAWAGFGMLALCASIVTCFGLGGRNHVEADEPKEIRPTTAFQTPFEIQDKNKRTVVRIEDDPVPALWLLGAKGESVKLVISDTGGAVSIRSAGGQAPSYFAYDTDGNGSVILRDKKGQPVSELTYSGTQVYNNGRVVAYFGRSQNGEGRIALGSTNGDALVDAGILDGRGIVRAYPYSPRTGEILRGSNFIIGAKK